MLILKHENVLCLEKVIKERKVYFDAKAKLHLLNYLRERNDNNPALLLH